MAILLGFAAWGGLALCIYSVCVAHACDIVDPGQIVSTVGSLLFSWAVGVTIGPLFGALAMDVMGPKGLFIYSAVISFLLMTFIIVRIRILPRPPGKGGFVDVSPTISPTAVMEPRLDRNVDAEPAAPADEPQPEPAASGDAEQSPHKSTPATATAETFS